MLFDLRGRGRRRTVQIIYGGLAALIGLGLIGLGVGGGFGSGGILNSLTGKEGTGSASFSAQIDKYRKLTQKQPQNPEAWEQLARAQLHEAGGEAYVNPNTGAVSAKGRELFAQAARSWEGYLALKPPKPNLELAKLMLRVYGVEGLNQPAAAVRALQLVVAAEPNSAAWYSQLALYAYLAKNSRVGDLAAAKAVALAPAPQRKQLRKQLAEVKKYPNGRPQSTSASQAASGAGSAAGTAAGTTTLPKGSTSTVTAPSTTAPSATVTTPPTTVPSTTAPAGTAPSTTAPTKK
jgi:hypothetical protein